MKSVLFILLTWGCSLICYTQDVDSTGYVSVKKDYSLAKVGFKIEGVYVYIMADPLFDYDYISTVTVKINWTGTTQESFERAIKKAKKQHWNFNGMIFHRDDLSKADLIRFNDIEIKKDGFSLGSKVSFVLKSQSVSWDKVYLVGEVIKFGTGTGGIFVKYVNKEGEELIKEFDPEDLTPISEEEFEKQSKEE